MFAGPARTARIAGVVNQDGFSFGGDAGAETVKIDLPSFFSDQVEMVKFHTEVFTDGLAKREAGPGDKNSIAAFAKSGYGIVNGTRASESKEHMVGIYGELGSAKPLSDCFSGGQSTSCFSVPIAGLGLDGLDDGFVNFWVQNVTIGLAGFAQAQVDDR